MMEKAKTRKAHYDAVLVAGLDNIVISDGAAGLSDELYAALMGSLNIVTKGEESV